MRNGRVATAISGNHSLILLRIFIEMLLIFPRFSLTFMVWECLDLIFGRSNFHFHKRRNCASKRLLIIGFYTKGKIGLLSLS